MISPGEVPSIKGFISGQHLTSGKKQKRLVPLSMAANIIEEVQPANPNQDTVSFSYYMECYEQYHLIQLLRNFFKNDEELINKASNICYSFSFEVNELGAYIEDSVFVPHVQLIINDIEIKNKVQYHDFIERYDDARSRFEEEVNVILSDGINDKSLQKTREVFYRHFSTPSRNRQLGYVKIDLKKKNDTESSPKFNSFYLTDLQKILKEGMNDTLSTYMNGQEQTLDVDENRSAIEQLLMPKNLPLGRWPSPVGHRLSMMQQIAVNHVVNEKEVISSVNGPPGTGKTTLLKDIFAQLIVERTIEMAKYDDPTKAFTMIGKHDIPTSNKTYTYSMFALDKNIAQYSMVVASTNNGAVENISKELPMLKEVMRLQEEPTKEERLKEIEKTGVDPIYDYAYAKEAEGLDLFRNVATHILEGEETWGLFSAALGRAKNIQTIGQSLMNKKGDKPSFKTILAEPLSNQSWKEIVNEFNTLRASVEQDRAELDDFAKLMSEAESLIMNEQTIQKKINQQELAQSKRQEALQLAEQEKDLINEQLNNLPQPNLMQKFMQLFMEKKAEEEVKMREQLNEVLLEQRKLLSETKNGTSTLDKLRVQVKVLQKRLGEIERFKQKYSNQNVILSTSSFWNKDMYEERQQSVLWQTNELNFKRGLLFLKALKVQKKFLEMNARPVNAAVSLLNNLRSVNLNIAEQKKYVENMWNTLHLVFPIMSTTFASFSSMYKGMGKDFIGYLFIDEAGQASPQQAAGALWRSRHAIVVGDPIQIEPVVTMDETLLADIREAFQIDDRYIGSTASVQTVADHANPIGTYKGEGENLERIGIPLWVHRRCIEPMFSIANEIAYENKMVLANKKIGKSAWYDIGGKAIQAQYVKEQGQFIVKQIEAHFAAHEEEGEPSIFVITPFTVVKDELKKLLNYHLKSKFENISEWINRSVGTVHTFQGKEADIVYFVTGTDIDTDGAANWSCMKPNLLNVAVTRAKTEFYVVGDKKRFTDKQYYDVIQQRMASFEQEESID